MVKRDAAAARHGSTESSGGDTLKGSIGGGKISSTGYMNGRDGRCVYVSTVSSTARRVPIETTSGLFSHLNNCTHLMVHDVLGQPTPCPRHDCI